MSAEGEEDEEARPRSEPSPADSPPSEPRPGGPPRWVLVVGGLVVGVVIGAGLGWWNSRSGGDEHAGSSEPAVAAETAEAAAELVEAWERSRTATYLTGSLLERTTATAAVLELPLIVAQRPPERVVSTGTSVEGSVDGLRQICDEQLDGVVRCQVAGPAADYDATVAAEVDTLRSYFEGELPVYRVAREGHCFLLRLTRAIQAPPYGQRARFCFDEASGAPSLQRIERDEGTDVVTLVSVRTDVTDEDLARGARGEVDESFRAGSEGVTGSSTTEG